MSAAPPFRIARTKDAPGVIWVDRVVDQTFRKALMDGVPPSLRGKMQEALAASPDSGAMAHSIRYFGKELGAIKERIAPLLIELDRVIATRYGLKGLFDWLNITNLGNDYRMIKAFKAWSDLELSKPAHPLPPKLIIPVTH